jgi:hypothetical protein
LEELAMTPDPKETKQPSERTEREIDKTVEDTFPASDPPANGGTTRIVSEDDEDLDEDPPE